MGSEPKRVMPPWAWPLITIGALGVLGAALGCWHVRKSTYLSFPTRFGRARIYQVEDDDGSPVRLLEVNGIVQSGTYIEDGREYELVFQYLKDYDRMFQTQRPLESVCVLGCGGYDYPEHLLAHHANLRIDAVEIDPAITALAERFFFLDRAIEEFDGTAPHRLRLIQDDALHHLTSASTTYDAIVNDTFDGGEVPEHLTTSHFYGAVKERLSPGGLFLTNIVAAIDGPDSGFLAEQVALMRAHFREVSVFPCAGSDDEGADNVVIIATDSPLPEELRAASI